MINSARTSTMGLHSIVLQRDYPVDHVAKIVMHAIAGRKKTIMISRNRNYDNKNVDFFLLYKDEQDQSRRQDCFVTYSGAFITAILIVTMRKNIYI